MGSSRSSRSRLVLIVGVLAVFVLLMILQGQSTENVERPTEETIVARTTRAPQDLREDAPKPVSTAAPEDNPEEPQETTQVPIATDKADGAPCDEPKYSSVECKDQGKDTFYGSRALYGLPIVNRSCIYRNIVFDKSIGKFVFYRNTKAGRDTPQGAPLQEVTLSSKVWDLMSRKVKRDQAIRKIGWTFDYRPLVRNGPIPCAEFPYDNRKLAFYSPVVSPWNYAHTLFCELFALFWAMTEFGVAAPDWQIVAVGVHYKTDIPFPRKASPAFPFFSRLTAIYDSDLPNAHFPMMVCGTGTKAWSWVTPEYRAAGSTELWWDFRKFLINVVGAKDRIPAHYTYQQALAMPSRLRQGSGGVTAAPPAEGNEQEEAGAVMDDEVKKRVRVSVCHKKDKRGIVNYNETVDALRQKFPQGVDFVLEGAVGKKARDQVQMMLDSDIYMCNEGTLGTAFFLLSPGSAFLSIPLAVHTPHLHQMHLGSAEHWWKKPDMLRPDPRKNTGGNIDWFPQAINWVHTEWYNYIPLKETRVPLPLKGNNMRNYMYDIDIRMQPTRLTPIMGRLIKWVKKPTVEESENYSQNAKMCRDLLRKNPEQTRAFNTAKCYFGMSWLCEFWTNTKPKWRFLHDKWHQSHGNCGDGNKTSPEMMGLEDPRDSWPMSDFLYYTRDELQVSYTTTDLSKKHDLKETKEEIDKVFPPE